MSDLHLSYGDLPSADALLSGVILNDPETYRRHFDAWDGQVPTIEEEEDTVRRTDPFETVDAANRASTRSFPDREPFFPLMRTIVSDVWSHYQLPTKDGLDIGSGPEGIMVRRLLPDQVERESWRQLECSPASCRSNSSLSPSLTVEEGSYHRLTPKFQRGFNIVTGLSTLDATMHQAHAISQIRDVMADDAWLFHMQDLRPTPLLAKVTLREMGEPLPFLSKAMGETPLIYLPRVLGHSPIHHTELFRRRLGQIIASTPGLELVCNQWVTATQALPEEERSQYYVHGLTFSRRVDPGETPVRQVSAIVTLARKVRTQVAALLPISGSWGTPPPPGETVDNARGSTTYISHAGESPTVKVRITGVPPRCLTTEDSPAHEVLAVANNVDGRYFHLSSNGRVYTERDPAERLWHAEATRPARWHEIDGKVLAVLQETMRQAVIPGTSNRRFPEAALELMP